jgi:biopolymer transport protein ExbD
MQSGRTRKRRKLKAEINVVPYIDVMLVLLIIFMVTAPLLNLGVDIHLPQSTAKAVQTDKEPIVISVDQGGKLYLTLGAGAEGTHRRRHAGQESFSIRAAESASAGADCRRLACELRRGLRDPAGAAAGGCGESRIDEPADSGPE